MKTMRVITGFIVCIALLSVPLSAYSVDHSDYGTVLDRHVRGGFFDYESFMNNRESRALLDDYLDAMSTVNPDNLERKEALAYWMNLYNAATLELIKKHYPVDSIRDIGGWFSSPWSVEFVETDRGTLTLDQIEHEIIRPEFNEPRVHFALVCAARSCPPLRHEPYEAKLLNRQLEHQARAFIRSGKNQFSIEDNRLNMTLSRILSPGWYAEDFGGTSGVVDYVSQFLDDKVAGYIENDRYRVRYIEYDWSLNQSPGPYNGFNGSENTSDSP